MSDTMIWTFGILGFLLLFFLGSVWFLKTGISAMPKPTPGGVSRKDIAELKAGLDQITTRLQSIEQILQSVE